MTMGKFENELEKGIRQNELEQKFREAMHGYSISDILEVLGTLLIKISKKV